VADTVDHIDGTDYTTQRYDPAMLRSLCTPCHSDRTRRQSLATQRKGDTMTTQPAEPDPTEDQPVPDTPTPTDEPDTTEQEQEQ
jgi:hypothetical protein